MNELYIPGDLVMTNGLYGGTAKDVIYKVASSDPSHIHVLSDGTVLKGLYRLKNLEGAKKIEDKGYLRYGCCYINFKDIVPVPLTTEILEKNGWEKGEVTGFSGRHYVRCRKDDVMVSFDDTGRITISYDAGNNRASFTLTAPVCTHELQHLLFGLGINEEWL